MCLHAHTYVQCQNGGSAVATLDNKCDQLDSQREGYRKPMKIKFWFDVEVQMLMIDERDSEDFKWHQSHAIVVHT